MNRLPDFYMILFHFFFSIYLRILTKLFIIIVGIIKKVARFFFVHFVLYYLGRSTEILFEKPPPPPPPPHPQAYDEFMPIGFDGNEKKNFFFHQN